MVHGRSTKIKWIRNIRLSKKNPLSGPYLAGATVMAVAGVLVAGEVRAVAVVPPAAAVRAAARVGIDRLHSTGWESSGSWENVREAAEVQSM